MRRFALLSRRPVVQITAGSPIGLRLIAAAIWLIASPASATATAPGYHATHPYAVHVAQAAERFGIPQGWIWAVMRQESGGNPRARSSVGAQGLMQIMPKTWNMLTALHGLGNDPYDVRANIHAGAAYLRLMWNRYRDVRLMLAAYNAGPGRADAYAAGRRRLPAETVNYVARIAPSLGNSGVASRASIPAPGAPSLYSHSVFVVRESSAPERREIAEGASKLRAQNDSRLTSDILRAPSRSPLFFDIKGSRK